MECCGDLWLSLGLPALEGAIVPAAAVAAAAAAAASGALVRASAAAAPCEVCGRPASRACACGLRLCVSGDCARRQHVAPGGARGARPHYPLLDAPGALSRRLALQQFESKRLEDAEAHAATLRLNDGRPPAHEEEAWRQLSAAAARAALRPPTSTTSHDPELARFWMWAQCSERVYLAIYVPGLRAGGELVVEASDPQGACPAARCVCHHRKRLTESSLASSRPARARRRRHADRPPAGGRAERRRTH